MSLFPQEKPSTSDWIHAHCDGGSRGNPGPSGFGALITGANGETLAELSEFLGIRTNNFAEYSGLLACLAYALENKYPRLKVVSDSELMVKQIQGKYKVNSPDLKPLWQEARNRIAKLQAFEISHALRHKNKEADALANQAMDLGTARGMNRPGSATGNAVQSLPLRPIQSAAARAASASPLLSSRTLTEAKGEGSAVASKPQTATPYPTKSTAPPDPYALNRTPASSPEKLSGTMHRGFTKDGVIHLLGGATLPDGVFVKIIRE